MKLYCNEKFIGFFEPRFDEWRLQFEHTPAVALSPTLSFTKGQQTASTQLKHFFINYLPEEPYADRVAARIKPYPRTYHDWLCALGQELTGAYALTSDGQQLSDSIYTELPAEKLYEALHPLKNSQDATGKAWQTAPLYDLICVCPYLPEQTLSMGLLDEYRAGWLTAQHWQELARLAGVSTTYLAKEITHLIDQAQAASTPLASTLRSTLSHEELDFLSERVNPVIQTRRQYLREAAASLAT